VTLHRWTTIRERAYTHDVSRGEHPDTTGGIHLVQIRRNRDGLLRYRIVQANGQRSYCSAARSEAEAISARWIRDGGRA
jgi:flagellar hook-associated protein FlgK